MHRKFSVAFHVTGTLSAALNIRWTAPSDCILKHVSAVASNTSSATLEVGSSADLNGYIAAFAIGQSNTPVQKEALTDFDGALAGSQFPRISNGDIVALTLDHDGDAGTAANDVSIVLTFMEG